MFEEVRLKKNIFKTIQRQAVITILLCSLSCTSYNAKKSYNVLFLGNSQFMVSGGIYIPFERFCSAADLQSEPVGQFKYFANAEDNFPNWSSDGSKIVFTSSRDGNQEIYIMNANGSSQSRVTHNAFQDRYPFWSPDDRKIAFIGDSNIYVMNADGSGQNRLTDSHAFSNPIWSPDGEKIACFNFQDENIYVINPDGSGLLRLTNHSSHNWSCSWTPDGSKILFTSNRDGNWEIYVMNPDGSDQTRLTFNSFRDDFPTCSPDGNKIAFSSERDGNLEIYVMNRDGSDQTRLTTDTERDLWPLWSPDGSKITFGTLRDGNLEIYTMNPDGSGQTNLTKNDGRDRMGSWSPDGRKIVFESIREGDSEVFTMDRNGVLISQLTNNVGNGPGRISPFMRDQIKDKRIFSLFNEQKFDFVVLRTRESDLLDETMLQETIEAYKKMHEEIVKSGAQSVLSMSYGSRDDNASKIMPKISEGFRKIKFELDTMRINGKYHTAILVPVGLFWEDCKKKFGKDSWFIDMWHGSRLAVYATACLFYTYITGNDPRKNTFNGHATPEQAEWIKDRAWWYKKMGT